MNYFLDLHVWDFKLISRRKVSEVLTDNEQKLDLRPKGKSTSSITSTVEALLMDTLVSGKLYLRSRLASQNPISGHSRKRPRTL